MRPRYLTALAALTCVLAAGACERSDPELQPDDLLRDSLGLGDADRVHTVRISTEADRERAEPATVEIVPGDLVQFMTEDRRPHTVAFLMDSLPDAEAAFLRGGAQEGSPPLVDPESRFLVSFRDAPEGRYPFVVEGTGEAARGVVVVAPPQGRR
ncbi:MAG: hypothetical protein KY453_08055 [Gemmatimonadetes bacterium]|nr:hypothetical protein [Gemmatimonadota bacterium]